MTSQQKRKNYWGYSVYPEQLRNEHLWHDIWNDHQSWKKAVQEWFMSPFSSQSILFWCMKDHRTKCIEEQKVYQAVSNECVFILSKPEKIYSSYFTYLSVALVSQPGTPGLDGSHRRCFISFNTYFHCYLSKWYNGDTLRSL